jgi:hypothetical protein
MTESEPEPWDHTYKGDSYWLEFRSQVIRLLEQEIAIGFSDIEADPWFQKQSHIEQAVQWDRARKRMVRGRPKAPDDTTELVQFWVDGRGGRKWYLARQDEVHCAAAIAVIKERIDTVRRKLLVRNLRMTWGIGSDAVCRNCENGDPRIAYDWKELKTNFVRLKLSNPKPLHTQGLPQGHGNGKDS